MPSKKDEKKHGEPVHPPAHHLSPQHRLAPSGPEAQRPSAQEQDAKESPRNPRGSDVVEERLLDAKRAERARAKAATPHTPILPSISFRLAKDSSKHEAHPPAAAHAAHTPNPPAATKHPSPVPTPVQSPPASPAPGRMTRTAPVPMWRRVAAWALVIGLLILFFYSNYTHNSLLDKYRAANQDFNDINTQQETQIADLSAQLTQALADVDSFKQASASLEGSKGTLEDQLQAANLRVAALQGEVTLAKNALDAQVAKDQGLIGVSVNATRAECNTHLIDLYNATEKACVKFNPDKVAKDLRTNLSGEVDVPGYLFD